MPGTFKDWTFNYETLARLSDWDVMRIRSDVHRGDLDIGHLEDAMYWLASNGTPQVRAELAKRLIPVVLGTRRKPQASREIENIVTAPDIMLQIFQRDREIRAVRQKKISKTKRIAKKRA